MIRITVDVKALVADLERTRERFRAGVLAGFSKASEAILELFRTKWLSGHFGSDQGLAIRTRNLYDSLREATTQDGTLTLAEVTNQGADYWYYHEHPQGGRPKRLSLEEDFEREGEPLYVGSVEQAWAGVGA